MCEGAGGSCGKGWRGWIDIGRQTPGRALGPWIDMSYPLSAEMPCATIFPAPRFELIKARPKDPFNVTELQMVVHAGTHVDAPRHFFNDAPAFDEIPLDRLHGPGVVWHIDMEPEGLIEPKDLECATPRLRPGDILALDTGWTSHFRNELYNRHPSLTPAAAQWLVEHKVKLLACDFATPDLVYHRRAAGFDWPVHRMLLSRGILICEHLVDREVLRGKRVEFAFCALNISSSDGAPARVIARPVAD
jgi:kynurenine formamidase